MKEKRYYLAVDIGASGGRHILGCVSDGKLELWEAYRFDNRMADKNGRLCWDTDALFSQVLKGMAVCKAMGRIPVTMGIDTWGVDFALLDKNDKLIGDTVAYRDKRTEGADAIIERLLPFPELYAQTGIQKQPFNTIYQLASLKRDAPQQLDGAKSFLMIPDYFGFLLTGVKKQEYTNATTTALVNAETRRWDHTLIDKIGFPAELFGDLSIPEATVGKLKNEIAETVGFDTRVVLPATHDTGSAFLAVPAPDEYSVYLSSGTWSLLGVENDKSIVTAESRAANFTNEGGFDGRYRYLKNIMGLWMLQSIRRELRDTYTFTELTQLAREAGLSGSVIDVNDSCFLAPDSMTEAVKALCAKTSQQVPKTTSELLNIVYRSLASCYSETIRELSKITGKKYKRINIVGGGCRDGYLNQITANASGLPVYAGPTEGTALGNLLAQMLAAGEFKTLQEARAAIADSFEIAVYEPAG